MERIGQSMLLIGVLIAIVSSLPFVASVVANAARPGDFPSQLMGPGWGFGAIVGFVGILVMAFGEYVPRGRRAV